MIDQVFLFIRVRGGAFASLAMLMLLAKGVVATDTTSPVVSTTTDSSTPALGSPLPFSESSARPLARVGDHIITLNDLMAAVRADPNLFKQLGSMEERARILRGIIENYLLSLAAMERAGLTPDSTREEQNEALRRLQREEFAVDEVTEDQLAEAWAARKDSMGIPAAVHIREIFFPVPANAEPAVREAARAQAEAALARARSGESFAALARELAHTQVLRDQGGDQGYLALTQFPYLVAATSGLREGDLGEVIALPGGFQVFQYLGRREAILITYEAAKERLRVEISEAAKTTKRNRFIQEYARKVGVEIKAPELSAAWPQPTPSVAQ